MSDEDFKQAKVEATQTVDTVAFVREGQIEPYYYDTPYYLEPSKRAQKSYALLRETLRQTKGWLWRTSCCARSSIWRC
jgi:DNA end-binding protein Ku